MKHAQKKLKEFKNIRVACRAIIIFAFLISIYANILYVAHNMTPERVIIATLPPVFVLLCWEVVSRVPLREDAKFLARYGRPAITLALVGGAAWLSYWHQKAAIDRHDENPHTGYVLPLIIDGCMVVISITVNELNVRIEKLEAILDAETHLASTKKERSDPAAEPVKDKPITTKHRIAAIVAQNPGLSVKDIARLAETQENYVRNVLSELKRAEKQPAEA